MDSTDGLLDRLRDYMGCSYISDLRRAFSSGRFQRRDPPAWMTDGAYSLDEWTKAVRYITGREQSFATIREAAGFLINRRTAQNANSQTKSVSTDRQS